ncbi:MAG: hypothetical protein Q8K69_16740, partial [Bacteroidota bacterium]|nr:hypothetical protein [Bacteroidota bacterium]
MKNLYLAILMLSTFWAQSQSILKSSSGETLYSWETQQAKVLPNGDLEWAPLPFELVKGSSVRYIDFDGGNDSNEGLSPATAWKRHPLDILATANAKAGSGIQT